MNENCNCNTNEKVVSEIIVLDHVTEIELIKNDSSSINLIQCCGCDDHAPCSCECGAFMG